MPMYILSESFRVRDRPLIDVAQAYELRGPRSEKTPRFVSDHGLDHGRTHLMAADAPSAQIGRRQDLEMVTPEVLAKSASRNVVALKNGMGHQVAGGRRRQAPTRNLAG